MQACLKLKCLDFFYVIFFNFIIQYLIDFELLFIFCYHIIKLKNIIEIHDMIHMNHKFTQLTYVNLICTLLNVYKNIILKYYFKVKRFDRSFWLSLSLDFFFLFRSHTLVFRSITLTESL
jgi:hypothetical protein